MLRNNVPVLVKNAAVVNEGQVFNSDVLLKDGRRARIAPEIGNLNFNYHELDAEGLHLLPGVIDNHVHFREPGLTHKGTIATESRAAVAGGITSFMEMPNTIPQTINLERLYEKYQLAARSSIANYAFYLGATNDNTEVVKRANDEDICGVKVFMGSSTGNMLVDDPETLETVFGSTRHLIAVHAEDEGVIATNLEKVKAKYGDQIPLEAHPLLRDEHCCYVASEKAVRLARKQNARLHVLHLTTGDEIPLFDEPGKPGSKLITTEACVHHLWFNSDDYAEYGNKLKCFPAIKNRQHQAALLRGLIDDNIDQVASDHAPHTMIEKHKPYREAPGGIPMVQHNLPAMLAFYRQNKIDLPTIVEKMCHNTALNYQVKARGFVREGYYGDCVLVNLDQPLRVQKSNIFSKCGWSPFEGHVFPGSVVYTFVNGQPVYQNGVVSEGTNGHALEFR